MPLWDAEIEGLRDQIVAERDALLSFFPTDVDPNADDYLDTVRAMFTTPLLPDVVERFVDGPAGPIRLRTFVPDDDPQAVMYNIHGGAWIMGAPEMNDLNNQRLCDELQVAVVSVDYRLAPEHPYPAGPDDCEAVAAWLLEHAEAEYGTPKLLIGGESAGGHLAAVTLLRVRDHLDAVDRFLGANLVFGVYDLGPTPSHLGIGAGPDILAPAMMASATEMFLPGHSPDDLHAPDLSPLYADLSGMPPALFSVGTADHLLDDSLFMAARWQHYGNRAELLVYPEGPHGCTMMPAITEHWTPRVVDFLRTCLKD
jgi:acetyl esterase/lipase